MSDTDRLEGNRRLYRRLVRRMGFEEKLWLLEVGGNYDRYEQRLRFLGKKHNVLKEATATK